MYTVSRDEGTGATLIGLVTSAALLGVVYAQMCLYYRTYPGDRIVTKMLVAGVFATDTMHQILIYHWLYNTLITNFGSYAGTSGLLWSIVVAPLFNGLTVLMVQCFLILRIRALCRNNGVGMWSSALAFALAVAQFGVESPNPMAWTV
ncbi:hypothetical protein FIBSPDRAFT_565578 [Athelia psychrophila]|uniref:Uncharacterized protein n=1 Tax=Athelia psychrophila TaxID=1759441 RepID=A0A166HXN4_9AGAM|nr:hypothetical protein FIBSPDRAFT_565578 [Fibularhizoctonia sp. CBS 109695]